MPGRPLRSVWTALQRIYGVAGQKSAPQDIEYDLAVQCVHDVARISELGASVMVTLTHSLASGGAGQSFSSLTKSNLFGTALMQQLLIDAGRSINNTDMYLHSVGMRGDGTNLVAGVMGITRPNDPPLNSVASPGNSAYDLVAFGSSSFGNALPVSGAGNPLVFFQDSKRWPLSWLGWVDLPARFQNLVFGVQDDTVGAAVVTFQEVISFVPAGAAPPVW